MNKLKMAVLLSVIGALSVSFQALAADDSKPASPAGGDRAAALRERMQQTAQELNLSAEQKDKLQSIIREQFEKLREVRLDTSLSQAEKMEKVKTLRQEAVESVKKVLTPEQFEKWKSKQGPVAGPAQSPFGPLHEAIQELNLTDEQKERLKPVYQAQMEKLRDLRQDSGLSVKAKLEKLKAARTEVTPKLKEVLTAEQFAKWEKSVDQWWEQIQKRVQAAKQD